MVQKEMQLTPYKTLDNIKKILHIGGNNVVVTKMEIYTVGEIMVMDK